MAVTEADVQRIFDYDTDLVPDAQPFIDDAQLLFDNVVGDAVTGDSADLVVKYLAAHLIAQKDAIVQSEQVKSLLVSYQYRLSDGLGITRYGATAMLLDPSKKLAQWNKQVVKGLAGPDFFWAGTSNT